MTVATLRFTAAAQGVPSVAGDTGYLRVTFPTVQEVGGPENIYYQQRRVYPFIGGVCDIPNIRPSDELIPSGATIKIEVFTSGRRMRRPVHTFWVLPTLADISGGIIDGDALVELPENSGGSGTGITPEQEAELAAAAAHIPDTTNVHGIADTSALVVTTDPRLNDPRPPTTHSHPQSDITGLAAALAAKVSTTDPRLSDARTPLPHSHPGGGGGGAFAYVGPWDAGTSYSDGETVKYAKSIWRYSDPTPSTPGGGGSATIRGTIQPRPGLTDSVWLADASTPAQVGDTLVIIERALYLTPGEPNAGSILNSNFTKISTTITPILGDPNFGVDAYMITRVWTRTVTGTDPAQVMTFANELYPMMYAVIFAGALAGSAVTASAGGKATSGAAPSVAGAVGNPHYVSFLNWGDDLLGADPITGPAGFTLDNQVGYPDAANGWQGRRTLTVTGATAPATGTWTKNGYWQATSVTVSGATVGAPPPDEDPRWVLLSEGGVDGSDGAPGGPGPKGDPGQDGADGTSGVNGASAVPALVTAAGAVSEVSAAQIISGPISGASHLIRGATPVQTNVGHMATVALTNPATNIALSLANGEYWGSTGLIRQPFPTEYIPSSLAGARTTLSLLWIGDSWLITSAQGVTTRVHTLLSTLRIPVLAIDAVSPADRTTFSTGINTLPDRAINPLTARGITVQVGNGTLTDCPHSRYTAGLSGASAYLPASRTVIIASPTGESTGQTSTALGRAADVDRYADGTSLTLEGQTATINSITDHPILVAIHAEIVGDGSIATTYRTLPDVATARREWFARLYSCRFGTWANAAAEGLALCSGSSVRRDRVYALLDVMFP